MRHRYIVATLFVTAAGSMAMAAYAAEPAPTPDAQGPAVIEGAAPPVPAGMPPSGQPCPRPQHHGPMMPFGGDMPMPPGGFPHRPNPVLLIAGRLSALETLIGIRSAQLDAWRDYTDALTDFLAPPKNQSEASSVIDDPHAHQPDHRTGHPPELLGEHIADRALERAAKANVLKEKAAALRNVLTGEQLAKLEDVERSLLPDPHPFP
ncbi:MAG: hypothetical protein E6Q76_14575 [Rhizobium sp.]|nr:MAG: hypothetical protein E6Q76_14575 [Rhizobium sp.]